MAFNIGKIAKGIFGVATSIIPGGGVVKGLLGLAAQKIPGADKILDQVFNEAEALYKERKDIRDAFLAEQKEQNRFILESEGKYADLRTKIEAILRSMTRPFLTVLCVVNLIIMIYLKIPIPEFFIIITGGLVGSWIGTKAIRDWRTKK